MKQNKDHIRLAKYASKSIPHKVYVNPNLPHKEKQIRKNDIKISDNCTFIDWNELSMDELAEYLENKFEYNSTGDALAILKMVNFYRNNKNDKLS